MKNNKQKGLTLVELLVVISIIGLLAVIVFGLSKAPAAKARDAKRIADLKQIQIILENYVNLVGHEYYPLHAAEEYKIVVDGKTIDWGDTFPGQGKIPKDPSADQDYVYISNGYTYQIYARLENENIASNLACTTACGPGQMYNVVIASDKDSDAWFCGDPVIFFYKGALEEYGTIHDLTTGKCWLDRNLGAKQAATSAKDEEAYGDLFQWGRGDDGHQERTSAIIPIPSESDNPGHGDFITDPNDWRALQNDNLWQGVRGINNPCPAGWRVPTLSEWQAGHNYGSFYSSLTTTGYRDGSSGIIIYEYSGRFGGYYQHSTPTGEGLTSMPIFSDVIFTIESAPRSKGKAVRCIQD